MHKSTSYILEVRPRIPARLARLEELANNLWYSWDLPTRDLFFHIHRDLWDEVGQNPKAFLHSVDEQRLIDASEDPIFLVSYNRVLAVYDSYHVKPARNSHTGGFAESDLVAYFCAEFGFHESFPIYSGGLGILAGDHCKSASDMHLPFVGVGLLYRRGYFHQAIDTLLLRYAGSRSLMRRAGYPNTAGSRFVHRARAPPVNCCGQRPRRYFFRSPLIRHTSLQA